ncbi:MAG TPA: fumarylacetoacetate hydrolase family protein, partial [Gaiellaceae bacterium]|nr:fumarylacetoacetate hydrolase family protein [Gaiellaceae bacterium]
DPGGEARLGALRDSTVRDAGPAGPQGFVPTEEKWAAIEGASGPEHALDDMRLLPPVLPATIAAIGLNYRSHAEESGLPIPDAPVLFAKLPSALIGPNGDMVIPAGRDRVDWEAELVLAIGTRGRNIPAEEAWSHVAGVMCGQDISDRAEQFRAVRQFTMAKSRDSYAPTGPVLVTPDELLNRDDVAVRCSVDGEEVQSGRTSDLIFPVPDLIAFISSWCTLEPGDLIYTGTPSGVGDSREPPRYLLPGNLVETEIEGIGMLRNTCVSG